MSYNPILSPLHSSCKPLFRVDRKFLTSLQMLRPRENVLVIKSTNKIGQLYFLFHESEKNVIYKKYFFS